LLDNTTLRNQLTSLERTVGAGDKETVTHPKHAAAHDDMSAAVAGAFMAALQAAQRAAQESNAIVAPIFFAGTASAVPGGSSFGSDVLVMPTPAALEASAPILQPSEQPKPVLNSPVAAKSGAETEAQRQRANADRSLGYKVMTERVRPWEPRPSLGNEPWRR
jgi:hypothetical protein